MNPYQALMRPVLFRINPEFVHKNALMAGRLLGSSPLFRAAAKTVFCYKNPALNTEVAGIHFENPIGLAGGFDKEGVLAGITPSLGFGFHEIGSVTAERNPGNPGRWLYRLPKDSSIAVNIGLASNGAEAVSLRLKGRSFCIPIGINIAKTNDPNIKGDASVEDYCKSFRLLKGVGDYVTLNISCPNSGDGRSFEDSELLEKLLKKVRDSGAVIFLKISPDITAGNLDRIISISLEHSIDGLIISNLTHDRTGLNTGTKQLEGIKGGLSGTPTREKSESLVRAAYMKSGRELYIIGVGGVFSGQDAYRKIVNGASLVQLITGMIYNGPGAVREINRGLVTLLEENGFRNVSEAVGTTA